LPRGSGIVTRRPLVLQLFYAKQGFSDIYGYVCLSEKEMKEIMTG